MKTKIALIIFLFVSKVSAQEQFSLFFASDKFELQTTELSRLNKWVSDNKEVKIIGVYGFCDEDGSAGYNDTLASKRINFVFNIILNQLKIRSDFKTRNFGELNNISKIKAENRRVTLFYIQPKDFEREDEILKIKKVEAAFTKIEINYPDKLVFENPDGTKSEMALDVAFMKQIASAKSGEKLKIENLNFQFNTFAVLPSSRSKLYELLLVLEKNPSLKIDIQGHICCNPGTKETLSTQRAKAVYSFLVGNNVDKNRLTYKGFGSTLPIFAVPEKNEIERAANRRVEILITAN